MKHNHKDGPCSLTCPNRVANKRRSAQMRCDEHGQINCPAPFHKEELLRAVTR